MKNVVTISREAGSLGDAVGYELARVLNFTCVNKGFVDLIARKARVAPWQVERAERAVVGGGGEARPACTAVYDERQGKGLEGLIHRLGYGEPLTSEEYLSALRQVMHDLAEIGDVVILGRGGQVLLRDWPTAFHLRILAPTEARIAKLQADTDISREWAVETIEIIDGLRDELLRSIGCHDINDRALYDLVLETGDRTKEECVETILHRLDYRWSLFEPVMGRLET